MYLLSAKQMHIYIEFTIRNWCSERNYAKQNYRSVSIIFYQMHQIFSFEIWTSQLHSGHLIIMPLF